MVQVEIDRPRVAEVCTRWGIRELSLFGSAVRGDMKPESDVDVLVSFRPEMEWDLIDLLHLQDELETLFGRSVDLVEREAIESNDNWIIRREILSTAEPLYASA